MEVMGGLDSMWRTRREDFKIAEMPLVDFENFFGHCFDHFASIGIDEAHADVAIMDPIGKGIVDDFGQACFDRQVEKCACEFDVVTGGHREFDPSYICAWRVGNRS